MEVDLAIGAKKKARGALSKKTANQASAAPRKGAQTAAGHSTTVYLCDMSKDKQFIVSCLKFRDMSARNRRQVVVNKRLCFNCLWRHNAKDCRSKVTCKKCASKHHTMLHEASVTRNTFATSSLTQPQLNRPAHRTLIEVSAHPVTQLGSAHHTRFDAWWIGNRKIGPQKTGPKIGSRKISLSENWPRKF